MNKLKCGLLVLASIMAITGTDLLAANDIADVTGSAAKYYNILLKRPDAGYVYERFVGSFLDNYDSEQLRGWLESRAQQEGETAQLVLGIYYLKNSDIGLAGEVFSKIVEADSGNYYAHYYLGQTRMQSLEFAKAAECYKLALSCDQVPEKLRDSIFNQLTRAYIRSEEQAKAIELWENKLKGNPSDVELHEDLLELYVDEDMYKQALSICDKLIDMVKDDRYETVIKSLRKADILLFSGKEQDALALYRDMLTNVGQDSWLEKEIVAQISQIFTRKSDKTGLVNYFADIVKDNPARTSFARKYAQVLASAGNGDKAGEIYKDLIARSPGDKEVALEYVQVLSTNKKYENAVEVLEALAEQFNGDLELLMMQAAMLNDADMKDKASEKILLYLDKSSKDEYAYIRTARMLEKVENVVAASKVFDDLIRQFPDSISAREVYADYLFKNEKKEQAVEILVALTDEPDRELFLRTCRSLNSYGYSDRALAAIDKHFESYAKDPVILMLASETACRVNEFNKAIDLAVQRLALSDDAELLDSSVELVMAAIKKSDRVNELIAEFEAKSDKTVQQLALLAMLLDSSGQWEQADKVLAEAVEKEPLLGLSRQVVLSKKRYDWSKASEQAIALCKTAGGNNSRNARDAAELLIKAGKYDLARQWIGKWRELSPGSTQPWLSEAQLCCDRFEIKEAVNILKKAAVKFNNDQQILSKLISVYEAFGDYRDAMRVCWKLYEETTNVTDKLRWVDKLGNIAVSHGVVIEVINNFAERSKTDKTDAVLHLALARLYHKTDDYELRRRELLEAGRLRPDDIHIVYEIAQIEELSGRWQDAVATLKKATSLDKTKRTEQKIASLYMQYGDEEVGVRMLLELSGGYDAPAEDAEKLADMLIMNGYCQQAIEYLDSVLTKCENDWRLKYLKAVAMMENQQDEKAISVFLQLMSSDEDLSRLKNMQQVDPYTSYYSGLNAIFPSDFIDTFMLLTRSWQAMSYKNNNVYYSANMRPSTRISLPVDVKILKDYCVLHILAAAQNFSYDKNDIEAKLQSAGVANSDILLAMPMSNGYAISTNELSSLVDEFPDNEGVLACAVLMGSSGEIEAQQCVKAYNVFKNKLPMTAAIAGLSQLKTEVIDKAVIKESIELLRNAEITNMMSFQLIVSLVPSIIESSDISTDDESDFADEILDIVYSAINKGRDKFSGSQVSQFSYMLGMYGGLLVKNESYDKFADFINHEIEYEKTHSSANNTNTPMIYSGGNNMFSQSDYPPVKIPGYPEILSAVFSQTNVYYYRSMYVFPEVLLEHIDSFDDKLVKLMIAESAESKDLAAKLAEELFADTENMSPGVVYFKAFYDIHNNDLVSGMNGLLTCRKMATQIQEKNEIDKAIVSFVLSYQQLPDESKSEQCPADKADWFVEQGQTAALHLQRAKLSTNQRVELADAMKSLGLNNEARLINMQVANAGNNSNSVSMGAYINNRFDTSKAKKMIDSGNSDGAVKLAKRYIDNMARQVANSNVRYDSYYMRQTVKFINENNLMADIINDLKPEDDKGSKSWCQYATACMLLDNKTAEQQAWEKAYQINNKDMQAAVYYALSIYNDDYLKSLDIIKAVPVRDISKQLIRLYNSAQSSYNEIFPKFTAGKFVVLAMEAGKLSSKQDYSFVYQVMTLLTRSIYIQSLGESLNSVFEKNNDVSIQDICNQRTQLFLAIVDRCMDIPELCDFSFSARLFFDMNQNDDGIVDKDKYTNLAWKAVESFKSGVDKSVIDPEAPGAVEYLLNNAFISGTLDGVLSDVTSKLETGNNSKLAQLVRNYGLLYTADEDVFIDTVHDVDKNNKRTNSRVSDLLVSNKCVIESAIEISDLRKLGVNLDETILDGLTTKSEPDIPTSTYIKYVRNIMNEDLARTRKFIANVGVRLTTTPERRSDYMEKQYNPHQGWSTNTPAGAVRYYMSLLDDLAEELDTAALVLPELAYVPASHIKDGIFQVRSLPHRLISNNDDIDIFRNVISNSGMISNLQDMVIAPAYSNYGSEESFTTFNGLVIHLMANSTNQKKEMFTTVISEMPDSFGKDYTLACIAQDWKKCLEVIGSSYLEIIALPEDKQIAVANMINETISKDRVEEFASALSDDARNWLESTIDLSGEKALNEFLAKKDKDILTNDVYDYVFIKDIGEVLRTIHDKDKINLVFDKADQLWEKGSRTGRLQKIDVPFRYYFFTKMRSYNLPVTNELAAMMFDTIRSGASKANVRGWEVQEAFSPTVEESYAHDYRKEQTVEALAKIVMAYSRIIGQGDASIVAPDLNRMIRQLADNDEKHKQLDKDIEALALAIELHDDGFNKDIIKQLRNYSKYKWIEKKKEKDYSELTDYYVNVLKSGDLSFSYKNALYNYMEGWFNPVLNDTLNCCMFNETVNAAEADESIIFDMIQNIFRQTIESYAKSEHNDQWKDTGLRMLKVFNRKYSAAVAKGSSPYIDNALLSRMLSIACNVGTADQSYNFDEILFYSDNKLRKSSESLYILIAEGYKDKAIELFANWKDGFSDLNYYCSKMSTESYGRVADFIETLEIDKDKQLAKILLYLVPDSSGDMKPPISKKERQELIANELKNLNIANPNLELVVLQYFTTDFNTVGILKDLLKEKVAGSSFWQLRQIDDDRKRQNMMAIYRGVFYNEIIDGKPELLLSTLAELGTVGSSREYYISNMRSDLARYVADIDHHIRHTNGSTAEQVSACADVSYEILKYVPGNTSMARNFNPDDYYTRFVSGLIAAGRADEYDDLIKLLPDDKNLWKDTVPVQGVFNRASSQCNSGNCSIETLLTGILKLMERPEYQKALNDNKVGVDRGVIRYLVKTCGLFANTMLDHPELFNPKNAFGWHYYNDLGILLRDSNRSGDDKSEKVISYFNSALEICGEDKDAIVQVKANTAAAYVILNDDIETARTMLSEVANDLDGISSSSKAVFDFAKGLVPDFEAKTEVSADATAIKS